MMFTKGDDSRIEAAFKKYPHKWKEIAEVAAIGKTASAIKARYYAFIKPATEANTLTHTKSGGGTEEESQPLRVLQPIEWDAYFFPAEESAESKRIEENKATNGEQQIMIEKQSESFYKKARAIFRSDSNMKDTKEEEYLFVGENEQTEGFFGRVNSIELYLDKTIDNENLKRLLCHEY